MRSRARKSRLRYLPIFLILLLPVATLAWLGNAELGRQEQRAAQALYSHAGSVVDDADRELRRVVGSLTERIQQDFDAGFAPLVELDRALQKDHDDVLGLVVLANDGTLLYPRSPPEDSSSWNLPFTEPSRSPEVRAAETLLEAGDLEGARILLEDFLNQGPRGRRGGGSRGGASRRRAWFRLGTIQLRLGALDDALASFEAAPRGSWRFSSAASIPLLCDVAIAEIACLKNAEDGIAQTLDVMQRIALGEHYLDIGDAVLGGVMEHLEELVGRSSSEGPESAVSRDAARSLIETDRVRRRGRTFAVDFETTLAPKVPRQVLTLNDVTQNTAAPTSNLRIDACYEDSSHHAVGLLSLRPIRLSEREQSPMALGDGAAWIGVRFHFERWFEEITTAAADTDSREGAFFLALNNTDGSGLLPRSTGSIERSSPLPTGFRPPTRRTVGGTILRAEPADPESFAQAASRSRRNRTLLILALFGVAGTGAWLLVRSASRESEVAALKMQLVSRVSHELKTPLALIKMYAETILRSAPRSTSTPSPSAPSRSMQQPLTAASDTDASATNTPTLDPTHKFAGIIDREADRLTAMVQRILDFARIENGKSPEPDAHTLDLGVTLQAIVDAFQPQAKSRGVVLEISIEDTPSPIEVHVDPGGLESAVLNLIENAVKYTAAALPAPAGDAAVSRVELHLRRDLPSSCAVFTVTDAGIGIPKDELRAVFEGFYRASNAKEAPGVGLGLSIVHAFFRAHRGSIFASARPDGRSGVVMTCSLPLQP